MPFEIRPVESLAELAEVGAMRQASYRLMSDPLQSIDELDFARHAIVLGAFDKQSQRLLGTMRILVGSRGPSEIARYVNLPTEWSQSPFGEARHLCVPRSSRYAIAIKILLYKSIYQIATEQQCSSLVIATRRALQGMYRLMHFDDVRQTPTTFIPDGTEHEHTVLGLSLDRLAERWGKDHEMKTFHRIFFQQTHPDLLLPSGGFVNPLTGAAIKEKGKSTLAPEVFSAAR